MKNLIKQIRQELKNKDTRPLHAEWEKLQVVNKKLAECYGDNDTTLIFGRVLSARKGSVTKASNRLFKEIVRLLGREQDKQIACYTMLLENEKAK